MGKLEKVIERLKSKPKDFTYDEAKILKPYQVKDLIEFLKERGAI